MILKSGSRDTPNIVLINDTFNWYHWGCTATSSVIRKRVKSVGGGYAFVPISWVMNLVDGPESIDDFDSSPFFKGIIRKNQELFSYLYAADVILINGEGSLHGFSKLVRNLLYLAYVAKRFMGKTVHIINHSVYPDDYREDSGSLNREIYRVVYQLIDYVAIRESKSHSLMKNMGVKAALAFDCLPLSLSTEHYPDNKEKKIIVAGSALMSAAVVAALTELVLHFSAVGFRVELLVGANADLFSANDEGLIKSLRESLCKGRFAVCQAASLEQWFAAIATADLLVSGRFHYSIAAAFLKTPFILLDSNTPKNRALADELNCSVLEFVDDFGAKLIDEASRRLRGGGLIATQRLNDLRLRAGLNFCPDVFL